MDLHALEAARTAAPSEVFRDEGLRERFREMFVLRAAGAPAQQLGRLQIGAHGGDQRLDHAQVADLLPADLARGRVSLVLSQNSRAAPQSRAGVLIRPYCRPTGATCERAKPGLPTTFAAESAPHGNAKQPDRRREIPSVFDGFDLKSLTFPRHQAGQRFLLQFAEHEEHAGDLAQVIHFFSPLKIRSPSTAPRRIQ